MLILILMLMLMLSRKADEHKHYLFQAQPLYPFMTFFNLSTGEGKQRWPLGSEHFPSQGVAVSVGDEDWGANGGNIFFQEAEFKPIQFSLCYFHAAVSERKSLVRKAGTRLTHIKQETLSSPAMSFITTWGQITGFHGKTCSTYSVRSCMVDTSRLITVQGTGKLSVLTMLTMPD